MVSEPCLGCDLVGHGPACFRLSRLHLTLSCLCPITTLHHAPSPINLVSLQPALSTTPPPSFGPVFCNHSWFKIFWSSNILIFELIQTSIVDLFHLCACDDVIYAWNDSQNNSMVQKSSLCNPPHIHPSLTISSFLLSCIIRKFLGELWLIWSNGPSALTYSKRTGCDSDGL